MRRTVVVLVIFAALALAGCIGSGSSDGSSAQGNDDPGTSDPDGSQDDAGTSGDQDEGDSDQEGPDGDDGASANDTRTPSDAMPGQDPAETAEGMAHFSIQEQANPAARTSFVGQAGTCQDSIQGNPIPAGELCTWRYNFTVAGDETRVAIALDWDSEMADLSLRFVDDRGTSVMGSEHGMVAAEPVSGFILPPNGTTWEYIRFSSDFEVIEPGDYTIEVEEYNIWDPQSATGLPWTLDVWVYTVPTDATHHPAQ